MKRIHYLRTRKILETFVVLQILIEFYSAGGLSIVGGGGKIDINDTFEERLKLLQDSALPAVRSTLFGDNENRKFYD